MRSTRLNNDNNPTSYQLPSDVPKAIAAITKALVLPDDATPDTIRAAFDALLAAKDTDPTSPENIEAACRAFGLSARESKMLAQMKVDPRKYVATKAQRGGGYKPRAK